MKTQLNGHFADWPDAALSVALLALASGHRLSPYGVSARVSFLNKKETTSVSRTTGVMRPGSLRVPSPFVHGCQEVIDRLVFWPEGPQKLAWVAWKGDSLVLSINSLMEGCPARASAALRWVKGRLSGGMQTVWNAPNEI